MRRRGAIAAVLVTVAVTGTFVRRSGAQYCPSFGTELHSCPWRSNIRCRVNPVVKNDPTFAELSDIFDRISAGPAKYGALGWNYSLTLTDGDGKPKAPTQVPAHYPCVLLKAVSAHESVGWNQFCKTTTPSSRVDGTQKTIVACDCGYGLMQVTSGMDQAHAAPTYDPNRVAGDPGYNVSVGSQIYGGKWQYGPSVGDRRVDIIEDWYFATWAYNGFAFSNNPNNPAYPADRKPYRDAGALAAGEYPYQEKIWGYVRVPYGLKETGTAGYKAYALSYPNRAQICASCGKPTADISDPSPTHPSDCPTEGGGPVTQPGPRYELGVTQNGGDDRFDDGASKSFADKVEGDEYVVDLTIKNAGDTTSPNVDLGVWIEEPFVKAKTWIIQSNAKDPMFATNDADARPDQPPRTDPGQQLTFHMNAFAIGETKRIRLTMRAVSYSLGLADHPDVRFWLKNAAGIYSKAEFDTPPTNPSKQEWNGGDLRAWTAVDVYSKTKWTFDGGTLEGWAAAGAATATIDAMEKSLNVEATGDDPQIIGPETSFDAALFPTLRLKAKSALPGPAKVYFATKDAPTLDEARAVELTLPTELGDVVVDLSKHPSYKGTITRLRIDPATSGTGLFVVADARMAGPGGAPIDPPIEADSGVAFGDSGFGDSGLGAGNDLETTDGEGGCGCRTHARPPSTAHGLALALALLALRRRRRSD